MIVIIMFLFCVFKRFRVLWKPSVLEMNVHFKTVPCFFRISPLMACRVLSFLLMFIEVFVEFESKTANVHLYTRYRGLGKAFSVSVIGPLHASVLVNII